MKREYSIVAWTGTRAVAAEFRFAQGLSILEE